MNRTDYEQGKLPVPLRHLREKPTFPEMVFHNLNAAEIAIDPDEFLNKRIRSNPRRGILSERHYTLLKRRKDVDKSQVKAAWNEWMRLGCYENGPGQQWALFCSAKRMADLRQLHDNLQELVEDDGKLEEWRERGLEECKRIGEWSEFFGYEDVYEDVPDLDLREPETLRSGGRFRDPDNWLGKEIFDLDSYKV